MRPCLAFARFCGRVDKNLVDGIVNGMAFVTERLSRWEGLFDRFGVDGLVNVLGQMVYVAGDWSRTIQAGRNWKPANRWRRHRLPTGWGR